MVAEVGVDYWQYFDTLWYSTHSSKKVYGALKAAREQSCTSHEKVAHRCGLEVEGRVWSCSLDNFKVDRVEE